MNGLERQSRCCYFSQIMKADIKSNVILRNATSCSKQQNTRLYNVQRTGLSPLEKRRTSGGCFTLAKHAQVSTATMKANPADRLPVKRNTV